LRDLAAASQENWLFVVDEAYHQFSGSDASALVRRYPHVVSLRTLSKAFGLGGVRLGYALMQSALAEQLQKAVMPFSVSALQSAVAETVLEAPGYTERYIEEAKRERERMFAALQVLPGVTPFPSSTNFILFKVPDAARVFKALLARGVVVRRQDHLPGLAGCLRVSVGTPVQNSAFLDALSAAAEPVVSGG
jgi:histidinol-phosphate aminotransferase